MSHIDAVLMCYDGDDAYSFSYIAEKYPIINSTKIPVCAQLCSPSQPTPAPTSSSQMLLVMTKVDLLGDELCNLHDQEYHIQPNEFARQHGLCWPPALVSCYLSASQREVCGHTLSLHDPYTRVPVILQPFSPFADQRCQRSSHQRQHAVQVPRRAHWQRYVHCCCCCCLVVIVLPHNSFHPRRRVVLVLEGLQDDHLHRHDHWSHCGHRHRRPQVHRRAGAVVGTTGGCDKARIVCLQGRTPPISGISYMLSRRRGPAPSPGSEPSFF